MFKLTTLDKITTDFFKMSFGNIIEWYDFSIYGLFALQLSQTFFPSDNKFISMLMVFATFATGFMARPLGALIFGMIGDRYGKHYAVNLSIWLMVIPTTLISFLPSYQAIGIFAPLTLVLFRICQGISAGGQFSGLITIAVDSNSKNHSFLVSLIYAISVVGSFLASFIGYLSISIIGGFHTQSILLNSLAWRIPFFLSCLLFLLYLIVNPHFNKEVIVDKNKLNVWQIIKRQPREFVILALLAAVNESLYYILFTYLVTYMQSYLSYSRGLSFVIMNGILFLSIILYPLFGYYAKDQYTRLNQAQSMCWYYLFGIALFALAYYERYIGLFGLIIMVISFCAITAMTTAFIAELFNKSYRMTACSLSFNLGGIVGGLAPIVAEVASKLSVFGLPLMLVIILISLWFILQYIKRIV